MVASFMKRKRNYLRKPKFFPKLNEGNNKDEKGHVKAFNKMMTEREQREGSRYGEKKPY